MREANPDGHPIVTTEPNRVPDPAISESPCFTLRGISKTYRPPGQPDLRAIQGLNVALPWRARIGILGHSGAGKSTLLHLLGLLDEPDPAPDDAGVDLLFHDTATSAISYLDREGDGIQPVRAVADRLKKRDFGFVFQRGHLLHHLSAEENVALKLMLDGIDPGQRASRSRELLRHLGLEKRQGHRTHQLSGGEAQRVAVLRALASSPRVVFADEPTGNLDRANASEVLSLLKTWQEAGTVTEPRTLLLVTHQIQDAWENCTHFLILRRDGGRQPRLWTKAELQARGGQAALAALLTENTSEQQRPDLPPFTRNATRGVPRGWDYLRLAWGDLLRREHLATTLANVFVLFFLLLLSFIGLALRAGMNDLVEERLQTLEATTFVVDGLKTREGYLTDALAAQLQTLTLDDGQPAFPPDGVHRFNLTIRQFRRSTPKGQAGLLADRPVRGRTALPGDPDLLALLPGGFSGSQAAEIIVTRRFLVRDCEIADAGGVVWLDDQGWDALARIAARAWPLTANAVWLDVHGQAVPLKIARVVESIRGGYSYLLPDGFEQLLRSPHFNPQPLAKGIGLGGIDDPAGMRQKLLADADLAQRLKEGRFELEVEPKRLVLRLAGGQVQRQDVMRRQGNTWSRLLTQRGWAAPNQIVVENLPPPEVELPPPTFGKATLHVRHVRDLEPLQKQLEPLGLSVPEEVRAVLKLLQNTIGPLSWMIFGIVILALIVGGVNLAVTMNQMVRARRVEIGILKANGMTRRQLVFLYALEGFLLAVVTTGLAWLAGWGLSVWLNQAAKDAQWPSLIVFESWWVMGTAIGAVVLATVVCWLATRWQARVSPAEAVA